MESLWYSTKHKAQVLMILINIGSMRLKGLYFLFSYAEANVELLLIGNKCDLNEQEQVDNQKAKVCTDLL